METGRNERTRSIVNEIKDTDEYWNEILFTVCKGVPSEMAALKRYDVFDFFDYIENKNKSTI